MGNQRKETRYVAQDGVDFYIYRDAGLTDLQTTWTYRGRVLQDRWWEDARKACIAQLEFAGYHVEWPNPFGGER